MQISLNVTGNISDIEKVVKALASIDSTIPLGIAKSPATSESPVAVEVKPRGRPRKMNTEELTEKVEKDVEEKKKRKEASKETKAKVDKIYSSKKDEEETPDEETEADPIGEEDFEDEEEGSDAEEEDEAEEIDFDSEIVPAAKGYAKKNGKDALIDLLRTKFKVEKIHHVPKDKYELFLKALKR